MKKDTKEIVKSVVHEADLSDFYNVSSYTKKIKYPKNAKRKHGFKIISNETKDLQG